MEELIEFYDARDLFVGKGNYHLKQDLTEGWRRLRACAHEEALYVCSLFPEGPPASAQEAKRVFLAQGENVVALCYAGLMNGVDRELLRRAAEKGHLFAQGQMAMWRGEESF